MELDQWHEDGVSRYLSGDGFPSALGCVLNTLQLFREWKYPLHQLWCFPAKKE